MAVQNKDIKKSYVDKRLLISILHFTNHILILSFVGWFVLFTYTGIFFRKLGIYMIGAVLILICYLLVDFWKEEVKKNLK